MRTLAKLAGVAAVCATISLSPAASSANEIIANFGGGANWFLSVQADETNRANVTQNARNNYAVFQQIGRQNSVTNVQAGRRNMSVVRQWGGNSETIVNQNARSNVANVVQKDMANSPLARYYRSSEFSYVLFYQSGQMSLVAVTPFALPSASYGRAH